MQLLMYPAAAVDMAQDNNDATAALLSVLSVVNASRLYQYASSAVYTAIAVVTLLWLLVVDILFVVVGIRMLHHTTQSRSMLRLLRALFKISVTIFFMPLSGIALSWFNCEGVGKLMPGGCWQATHIAGVVGFSLALPLFVLISLVVSMLYIDRDMTQVRNVSTLTDGRGEAVLIVLKLLVTASFTALRVAVSDDVRLFLITCVSAVLLYLFIWQQPHYYPGMNYTRAGFAGAFLWLTLVAIIAALGVTFANGWVVVMGMVPSAAAAALIARARYLSVIQAPIASLSSSRTMVQWAAARIRAAILLQNDDAEYLRADLGHGLTAVTTENDGEAEGGDYVTRAATDREVKTVVGGRSDEISAVPGLAMLMIRPVPRSEMVTALQHEADRGMRAVLAQHKTSSISMLVVAAYFGNMELYGSRFLELTALGQAANHSNAADVLFSVYRRSRQLRESTSPDTQRSRISTVDRIMLEQHMRDAKRSELDAFKARAALYGELDKTTPDLYQLQTIATQLWTATQNARSQLDAAMRITRSSNTTVLRAYADFLQQVCEDGQAATELSGQIAQLESLSQSTVGVQHQFKFAALASPLSSDDSTCATITVSAEAGRMGRIISVSPGACRVVGASKVELLGRNITAIMPRAIAEVHQQFLNRFAATGHSKFMNATRCLFLINTSGQIVPVRAALSEVLPDSQQIAPIWSLLMQPLELSVRLMTLEYAEQSGWRCTHTCAATATALESSAGFTASADKPSWDCPPISRLLPEMDLVPFFTRDLGISVRTLNRTGSNLGQSSSASVLSMHSASESVLGNLRGEFSAGDLHADPGSDADGEGDAADKQDRQRALTINELTHRLRAGGEALERRLRGMGLSPKIVAGMLKRAVRKPLMQAAVGKWARTVMVLRKGESMDVEVQIQRIILPKTAPLLIVQWRPHDAGIVRDLGSGASVAGAQRLAATGACSAIGEESEELGDALAASARQHALLHRAASPADITEYDGSSAEEGNDVAALARGAAVQVLSPPTAASAAALTETKSGFFNDVRTLLADEAGLRSPAERAEPTGSRESARQSDEFMGEAATVEHQDSNRRHQLTFLDKNGAVVSSGTGWAETELDRESAGMHTSSTSRLSIQTKTLRRAVFLQTAEREETVRGMRRILLGLVASVALAAATIISVDWPSHGTLMSNFNMVHAAGERTRSGMAGFTAIAQMYSIQKGADLGNITMKYGIAELNYAAQRFAAAHQSMLNECSDCLAAQVPLMLHELDHHRVIDGAVSAAVWLNAAFKSAKSDIEKLGQLDANSIAVDTVLDSVPETVVPAFHQAMDRYLSLFESNVEQALLLDVYIFSCMFAVQFIGCAVLLAAQARKLSSQRRQVLRLLMLVPRPEVHHLRGITDNKLQLMTRRQMEGDDVADDADSQMSEAGPDTEPEFEKAQTHKISTRDGLGQKVEPSVGYKLAKMRRHVDSGNFTVLAVARLLSPLLLMVVWLASLYSNSYLSLEHARVNAKRLVYLQQAGIMSSLAHQNLLASMGAVTDLPSVAFTKSLRDSAYELANSALDNFQKGTKGTSADDEEDDISIPPLQPGESLWGPLMEDACGSITSPGCREFDGKVWTAGAGAGLQRFVTYVTGTYTHQVEAQVNLTEADLTTLTVAKTMTGHPELRQMYIMMALSDQWYMSQVLTAVTDLRRSEIVVELTDMRWRSVWLSVGAFVVFSVTILGYFMKRATKLSESITAARVLVMMLPDQLIERLPALLSELQTMVHTLTMAQQHNPPLQQASALAPAAWQDAATE